MEKIVVYPGTFDPITHGHVDLIYRAARLYQTVIIAIAASAVKSPIFSLDERLATVKEIFSHKNTIVIEVFSGLLVNFMQEQNTTVILRGIRTCTDMEYEFQLANMHRCLKPNIETIFLKANDQFTHISSSIVREIATMGGDLSAFVPPPVVAAFARRTNGFNK